MAGYSQTWAELVCPKCKSNNFVNCGDISDLTAFDPTACKCWKCGCCFDFEGEVIEDEDDAEFCDEGVHFERIESGN